MAHDHLPGPTLDALWDMADPSGSRARLEAAAEEASDPVREELLTQVARAWGLAGETARGREVLDQVRSDDPVVAQRVALERGRLAMVDGDQAAATELFEAAHERCADPYLCVDALHMLAIVDPQRSLQHTQQGLAVARASDDERVRRWEGPLLNNHAWNLAEDGFLDDAYEIFVQAEGWFTKHGSDIQVHRARWAVGHVLRRLGRSEEAWAVMEQLALESPDDPSVAEEQRLLAAELDARDDGATR